MERDKSLPLEERRKELWDEKSLSEIRKIINKKSS